MAVPQICAKCGSEKPVHSPGGLCPVCMLREGLDGNDSSLDRGPHGNTTDLPFKRGSVLDSIADTFGSVPRVLLRDTAVGETPSPIVRPIADADPTLRYRIDGEIAQGGMGSVLKGHDPDLGRDVAIKVLLEGLSDNADMVRRFVEEAQIGGQLQHPGVVPIYELGTFADQRPFFSMKLVKGQTLTELLSARSGPGQRVEQKTEARAKDLSKTLSLTLQACEIPAGGLPRFLSIYAAVAQTMAYAHTRGVIHRDLKPSNVMVGSFGEVQVMDWGLAKVLPRGGIADDAKAGKVRPQETVIATARSGSGTDLSHAGSIMGTPSYMAPEQARGEIDRMDERADVFALGSILCEILTGTPAFTGGSSGEIVRKAAKGETGNALARLDGCGAESDLIVLAKDCLAPELEDRPRDAGLVAERITAYLAGVQERVQAAERSRAVAEARAVEEQRRRKLQLGLAASVLALTVMGGSAAAYMVQQRQVRAAAVDRVLGKAITLLAQANDQPEDPARWRAALGAAQQVEDAPGGSAQAVAMLTKMKTEAQSGLQDAERDVLLRQTLLEVRANEQDAGSTATDRAIVDAFRAAGLDLESMSTVELATRIKRRPAAVVLELAAFLDHASAMRRRSKQTTEKWRKPLELARGVDPEPYRDRLRELLMAEDLKEQAPALVALAREPRAGELSSPTAILLADSLDRAGEIDAGVALLKKVVNRLPNDVWINFSLAGALERQHPSRREEAVRYYSVARGLKPEIAHDLAHLLERMGQVEEAEGVFRDLVARRPDHVRHLGCFGNGLQKRGRRVEAQPILDRAVLVGRAIVDRRPDDVSARTQLGNALKAWGDLEAAIVEYRKAIQLRPDDSITHFNLAYALEQREDFDEALAEARKAVELAPDDAGNHASLAKRLLDKGDYDAVIAESREAIRLDANEYEAHSSLGMALGYKGLTQEAIAEFRESLRLNPASSGTHDNFAIFLQSKGNIDAAIAEYREAIRLNPGNGATYSNLGFALFEKKEFEAARIACKEAIRLAPKHDGGYLNLGNALMALNRVDEAITTIRTAIRLKPTRYLNHIRLAEALKLEGKYDEAIASLKEAIRVAANLPEPHEALGHFLYSRQDYDRAIIEFREATRLRPDIAINHHNVGAALRRHGKADEAIASLREAIRLDPKFAGAHEELGAVFLERREFDLAAVEFREAIRLDAGLFHPYNALGSILCDVVQDFDGAIAMFKHAIRIDPKSHDAHFNLGNALRRNQKFEEAVASYREGIRLAPPGALWHMNIGLALQSLGRLDEALVEYRKDAELAPPGSKRAEEIAGLIRRAEAGLALERRLPDVIAGKDKPANLGENLDFAQLCYERKFCAASARLLAAAFVMEPKVVEDRRFQFRYNAACAATLAAGGQGNDDPKPDDAAKTKLREQALGWLKAELSVWKLVATTIEPGNKEFVTKTLEHWKKDTDLAGVRDEPELAKLPEPQRQAWKTLWADVTELLKQVEKPG